MDRRTWLAQRRAAVDATYSSVGPTYDDGYDPATPVHRRFVSALIDTSPEGGVILDAACGTGPYVGMILGVGRRVVGVDQCAGMLERARAKHPDVRFERVGLQELAFDAEFDAAMCIDAMEHVPPEEWPLVLEHVRRAVKPGGHAYLTVEQIDRSSLEDAQVAAAADGSPAVFGEVVGEGTGGYHFYPDRDQVAAWLVDAGFETVDQEDEWLEGYGYHHLLVRARGPRPASVDASG
jgi:ubiquinone/menaquinone biosynthesis C-methylase UbiE